ncbi:MAG: tripartite tricarboxylate transporter TctB family protein [Pseudomonadota bacterium]
MLDKLTDRMSAITWFSLVSLATAIAMFALVPNQVEKPPAIFGMESEGLNPEFFPHVVTALWMLTSIWMLVDSFITPPKPETEKTPQGAYVRVLVTLGAALAYTLALVWLGFVASSAVVIIMLSLFLGARNPFKIGLVAIVVPSAVFLIFTRLLHVSLPPFPYQLIGG